MSKDLPTSRKAMLIGVILGVLIAALYFSFRPQRRQGPFELGFWYWHSPYSVSPLEEKTLKSLGLNKMFVRAGTFSTDGKNAVLVLPQVYEKLPDLELHLVFNFDSGFVRHFEEFELEKVAKQVAQRIEIQRAKVPKAVGIQLDLDCPTRLLPRYAQFVRAVRGQFGKDLKWSATGLLSWLGTSGVRSLSQELDFLVPQAYEGVTGRTVDKMRPVSDPDYLKSVMGKAEALACPYYFGIPAYGHGFQFDAEDALIDIYQGIGPVEAMRHRSFKLLDAYPANRLGKAAKDRKASTGEQIIKFKAVRPAPNGRGLNYTLAYTVPSPNLLKQMLELVRKESGPGCLGAIIYRYPEPDSTLTLSLPSIVDVLKDRKPQPKLTVQMEKQVDNFEAIESGAQPGSAPADVFLSVQNTGNAATFIAPDAAVVTVVFDKPGIGETRLRDFDSASVGVVSPAGEFRSAPSRSATAIRLSTAYLAPGQKAFAGPIRLRESDAKTIRIQWIIRDGNGFDFYTGESQTPPDAARKPHK